ncbi:MAG TPA: ATP-binding protein [Kofleriaceae bacterium]|jgi:PAS domain S-box-containing protein
MAEPVKDNWKLFELMPVAACVFDRATLQHIAVNPAMCASYGYTRDELLGLALPDLKFPEDSVDRAKITTSRSGETRHVGLVRHRTKQGTALELDVTAHAIEFDGHPAILSMRIDVTEARKLELQLHHSQRLETIGRLAGGIAHDFNNLLGVIVSNAELALERTPASDGDELREIGAAAERAASLTRQLLSFSRPHDRDRAQVDCTDALGELNKMLARIVGEDIELCLRLPRDRALASIERGQLEQILVNLVVNARDAMPRGGSLAIETKHAHLEPALATSLGVTAGEYVMISVSDTGCGMSPEVRARIFEPYFTTKPTGKGTGLGLALVSSITRAVGGGIDVYSELGRGTTFRIYLPRIATVPIVTRRRQTTLARGHECVLVVEDDANLRSALVRRLAALGYTVLEAADPARALELCTGHDGAIDLLLTDLVLPAMNGRELADEAKRARPQLRVLFMSGYTEHVAIQTHQLSSDENFVEKPFTAIALASSLRRALGATA